MFLNNFNKDKKNNRQSIAFSDICSSNEIYAKYLNGKILSGIGNAHNKARMEFVIN